ncbi:MAG TPA: FAD-dependent oxidoreductase [Trebonia sp.]|jgi:D-amino-acid oxidase|nr:FAD-dependent oxidoreductase [Trebonia sp.]
MTQQLDALVVGAGVIGLTTAIALAEAGLATRVRAAAPPGRTTSFAAGAIWGPVRTGTSSRVLEWSRVGLEVMSALADDPRAGIRAVSGIEVSAVAADPPEWAGLLPGARRLGPGELPAGYASGWRYTAPVAAMPRYLDYLAGRLRAAGGTLDTASPVGSLRDPGLGAPVVVNCAGIGARELVPDPAVVPVRGQVVVVANPGIEEFFRAPGDGPESVYMFPHGDVLLLGGSADEGDWDLSPRESVTTRILADCAQIEPRLRGTAVLDERVGLRPGRPQARLESQALGDGRVLWHNYGHGGAGVTLAWGCAREIAAAVAGS